jgi:MFS family permease
MAKTGRTVGAKDPVTLQAPGAKSAPRTGWLFAGLFLLYMFDYIDREVVSAVLPLLQQEWGGISDTQVALLKSAVYLSIVILVFPISFLVDRWSRKRSIGLMVMLWSIATGAAAFIKTFPQLLVTRLFVGFGEAGYAPGGGAMISALYPVEKRSRMMGLWNAAIPLGSAMGVLLGGQIAEAWGWKAAFGIVAIPGLIIGILFFFFARDYKTVKLEKADASGTGVHKMRFGETARDLLQKPSLILTYFAFAANTFLTSAFLTWLGSYFIRTQGLSLGKADFRASTIMIMAIVGAPLGGFLVDAWRKKNASARPLFAGLTSLLGAAMWFIAFTLLSGTAQYIGMMAAAIVTLMYLPAAAAITQDVVHPGLWAISYALCVMVQNALGSMTAPPIVGLISDAAGAGAKGLTTALQIVPVFAVVAGVLFLLAALFYKRDLERTVKVKVEMES